VHLIPGEADVKNIISTAWMLFNFFAVLFVF